jgi:hypothetical protein
VTNPRSQSPFSTHSAQCPWQLLTRQPPYQLQHPRLQQPVSRVSALLCSFDNSSTPNRAHPLSHPVSSTTTAHPHTHHGNRGYQPRVKFAQPLQTKPRTTQTASVHNTSHNNTTTTASATYTTQTHTPPRSGAQQHRASVHTGAQSHTNAQPVATTCTPSPHDCRSISFNDPSPWAHHTRHRSSKAQ